MSRCRFVEDDKVRLFLVDVHRRAYQTRQEQPATTKDEDIEKAKDLDALQLSINEAEEDADWIDVRRELNAGEQQDQFGEFVKDMTIGEKIKLDPKRVNLAKLIGYIIGWSFVNADGRPELVDESSIRHLDTETFRELTEAVNWHETQVEVKRAERKKKRVIATVS